MNLKTMANNTHSAYHTAGGGRYEIVSPEKSAAAVRKDFAADMLRIQIERQVGGEKEAQAGLIKRAKFRVMDGSLIPGEDIIRDDRGPVYETLPIYYRQGVGGSADKFVLDKVSCEADAAQKPTATTGAEMEAGKAKISAKAEGTAGAAKQPEAEETVETDDGKCDVMKLVIDSNSPFYQEMYQKMKLQLEQSEEEKRKQAIIDALDAILESMSAKKDDWKKKPDTVSSMAELSKTIDSLDKDDPRKEELNLLRERLQQVGIYADLDVGVKDKEQWGETLTQSLIREETQESEPSLFDII